MVNSNSKSRSAVENSSDAPTPNIYKYTATLKFLLGDEVHDVDFYSIKTVVIDRNYKEMNMPMIFVTASIDRKVVDLMVQNQKTGSVIFDMKRCIYNSDMPDLFEDYIVDKFVYFISDDINKNDKQDFEGEISPEEDALMRIAIDCFGEYTTITRNRNTTELLFAATEAASAKHPGKLADIIAGVLDTSEERKQSLLELVTPAQRLHMVIQIINYEIEI